MADIKGAEKKTVEPEKKAKVLLDTLEEDDEFEEFEQMSEFETCINFLAMSLFTVPLRV